MSGLYERARALADCGVPVFPLNADKSPRTARGFHDATITPEPGDFAGATLIGTPTGELGGFDVLDIDPRHGGDVWLRENESRLPVTMRVRTQSGGWHIYFEHAPGMRCSAGRIAPGVDVRAGGGYVAAWREAGFPVENADALAPWPDWIARAAAKPRETPADAATLAPPSADAAVALLDSMSNPAEAGRDVYLGVMLAAKGCADGLAARDGVDALAEIGEAATGWAARWPASPGADVERAKWEGDWSLRDAPLAGWEQLLHHARRLGADTSAHTAAAFAGVQADPPRVAGILHPADCAVEGGRGYIIKHLLAPGDVGAVIGQPGAGKSQLAPYLAYGIAQGRTVFGLRTKQARALYVAAEDFSGMRQRVVALRQQHGDAPDFGLTECGNLNDAAARTALTGKIAAYRPAVVFVDTLAAAFGGMDENDSAAMGGVVAFARKIAATGVGVVLIHHPAKHGDGTPRGHSALNGTLDMCLFLEAGDDRVVTGRLTKNRNGTTERTITFTTGVALLGVDDDGDPVTAPYALETVLPAVTRPRLSPREQRAFEVLRGLSVDGEGVAKSVWHAECEDKAVIVSDDARNRRTAVEAVMRKLLEKGVVSATGGLFRPVCSLAGAETAQQPETACNSPKTGVQQPATGQAA